MPQTREAVAHAKAAKVPILVAMNKIDKPNAESDRLKQQLAEIGLVPDEWDGDTIVVPLSAKKRPVSKIYWKPSCWLPITPSSRLIRRGHVIGTVIEAEIDRAKGVLATLLVQNGTLEVGDAVVVGTAYGRLRAMFDHLGHRCAKAEPSTPVAVMGPQRCAPGWRPVSSR